MIENDFYKLCESILNGLKNKEEYVQLCKNSWNFDNCKGLNKNEAHDVKKTLDLDFKLAGSEKMFYKDYYFDRMQLRFMIPYGHGMMDCSYRVFSGMSDNSIPSFSFRQIVRSITGDFENHEFTFPMNTSFEEYKENLKFILILNEQIVRLFDNEIVKMNSFKN